MAPLFRYGTLDSTNDEARRLLGRGSLPPLSCILADAQIAGRGSRGRRWISPPGAGLYFSAVHARPPAGELTTDYTLAAGVACVESCAAVLGLEVRLKPVNDLLAAGGKLGGILVEGIWAGEEMLGLITGIGINGAAELRCVSPGSVPPVSLEEALPGFRWGPEVRDALALDLLPRLDAWYRRIFAAEREAVVAAWENYSLRGFCGKDEDGR